MRIGRCACFLALFLLGSRTGAFSGPHGGGVRYARAHRSGARGLRVAEAHLHSAEEIMKGALPGSRPGRETCSGVAPCLRKFLAPYAVGGLMFVASFLGGADAALGADSQRVGSIPASGFIFKDTLDVTSFKDPKVSGVTLYVSDFSKPITERIQGDFFSDPSTASITCVSDGSVKVASNIERSKEGEEVFSEAKSLLFKSVKVRRIYDEDSKNVIYVSYSQKLVSNDDSNKSRFKSSLCAVHVDESGNGR